MTESTGTPQDALHSEAKEIKLTEKAGLLVADAAVKSAIASVLGQLGLDVQHLDEDDLDIQLSELEIVVADESRARVLRSKLDVTQKDAESIKPALVAIGPKQPADDISSYDAFIIVPSMLHEVTARLSVVLYSHRALARRNQTALEELSLNRDIFRSVTNGISVANAQLPDMPLMYVNPSFELMTGYSLEEIQGRNCRFLQGGDRDQPGLTLIREAIAQGRQTVAIVRNYRKDGSCFWNELTISPVRNREGELTHFVGIQADVTERVRIEGALRESEKLAVVGRLASSISHEINNPFESVMNLVYLANQSLPADPTNEETRQFLESADHELARMRLITSQSLKFGRQTTKPQAVLINDIVDSVLDLYTARLRNYGVEISKRLRSTQHVVMLQSEIRQVLSNLVANSIDALKNEPRRCITIRTREATDHRSKRSGVLLTISDSGPGIPLEVQQQMFTAFYSTKGMNGSGLGLWISRGIMDRHHGKLILRSRSGQARNHTTFHLFLPFQAAFGDITSEGTTGGVTHDDLAGANVPAYPHGASLLDTTSTARQYQQS